MGSCPTLQGLRRAMRNLLSLLLVAVAANANPLLLGGGGGGADDIKPGGGSFPFVTTETVTRTIVTDSYCYTTEKKLLGPKTKECKGSRAIDTSHIMGLPAGDQVAKSIAPTVTQVKPEEETALDASGQSENPREGKFCCYAVTKTETSTVFRITATTTVTFKCTPSMSILNMCDGSKKDSKPFGDLFDNKKDTLSNLNPLGGLGGGLGGLGN